MVDSVPPLPLTAFIFEFIFGCCLAVPSFYFIKWWWPKKKQILKAYWKGLWPSNKDLNLKEIWKDWCSYFKVVFIVYMAILSPVVFLTGVLMILDAISALFL